MPLSLTSPNNFSNLNMQDLADTFNLQHFQLAFSELGLLENQDKLIQKIVKNSSQKIMYWNEQELIMKHIAFILDIVDFSGDNFDAFAERNLSGFVEGVEFVGIMDFVVARGEYEPREPYFFIQEYKRFKMGENSDPQAQVLAEMLVAQVLNNEKTVYGCYIIGKFWYFVILEDKKYTISKELDSTNLEELTEIIGKLNWVKSYVEEKLSKK